MSVDEVEPIEAEAAEENAVAPQGTHLASTQTITHEYLTQSGKVMRETVTTNQTVTAVMDFVYDESGKPFALNYSTNGGSSFTTYYYVLNLQGDVVKLIDQDGAVAAAYAYDAWGNILSSSGSMTEKNPLRYRGYYYDSETGFYYLQSRYYDPTNHRFINADSYASTGQGFVGTNMFAYCNNNPVNREDLTGQFWSEVWEFLKTAFTETGNAIETMAPAYAGCEAAAVADGPLPFGDIAALIGAAALTIGATGYGIYQAATSDTKIEARDVAIAVPTDQRRQAYFPYNPYAFLPRGLEMIEYSGTKNGRTIEWRDPITKIRVFEWDEDFSNGSHYHALLPEWGGMHDGTHYLPGSPVPEPWNTIYFGD